MNNVNVAPVNMQPDQVIAAADVLIDAVRRQNTNKVELKLRLDALGETWLITIEFVGREDQ